jgi:hypothetical protein
MKGALTLFAQDATSKLILYTGADIKKDEADDEILEFLSFFKTTHRKTKPTFIFDSKFTTYANLSELNGQGVKFITLRRRGRRIVEDTDKLSPWVRITIPHEKRTYPHPEVYESSVPLKGYEGTVRQVIVRGNGHESPAYLVSNDFDSPCGDHRGNSRPPVAGGERHLGGGKVLPSQQSLFADPRQGALRRGDDHDRRHSLFNARPALERVRAL